MPRSTPVRRRGPNGRFLSSSTRTDAASATTPPQSYTFLTLPTEVRCTVYGCLFGGSDCVLRRLADSRARETAPYITVFDNAIIRTCKTICDEALPVFYSTPRFHYSAQLEGFRPHPHFLLMHTAWVKHLSIEVTLKSQTIKELDATVAAHVQTVNDHFTTLTSFTLHVIPTAEMNVVFKATGVFAQGAAAKALKTLCSRIVLLRIVMFGMWHDLHDFRSAIADEEKWVQGDKCWGEWPELGLTGEQYTALLVRQRRYTLVGSENVIHPHKVCIRVFNLYQPWMKRSSHEGERLNEAQFIY